MKSWFLGRSRARTAALFSFAVAAAATAWWFLTAPPKLRLHQAIEPPPEFRNEPATVEGFSPDGSLLVVEHEPSDSPWALMIRRVATGRIEKVIDSASLDERGEDDTSDDVLEAFRGLIPAFSPDGRLLAVGMEQRSVVKVFNTATWSEERTLRLEPLVDCRFFPDGKTLLLNTDRGFAVWDATTGRRLLTLEGWRQEDGDKTRCWISPDGRELTLVELVEPEKQESGYSWRIGTWDTATWSLRRELHRPCPEDDSFEIAPNGKFLACAGDGGRIEIQDIATGTCLHDLDLTDLEPSVDGDQAVHSVAGWSPDSRAVLITSDDVSSCMNTDVTMWVWDIENARAWSCSTSGSLPAFRTKNHPRMLATEFTPSAIENGWIYRLPLSFQSVASRCFGSPQPRQLPSQISVREPLTGTLLGQTSLDDGSVTSLAFSPDGTLLFMGHNSGRVLAFSAPRARE